MAVDQQLIINELTRLGAVLSQIGADLDSVIKHTRTVDKVLEGVMPKGKSYEAEFNRCFEELYPPPQKEIPDNVVTRDELQAQILDLKDQITTQLVQTWDGIRSLLESYTAPTPGAMQPTEDMPADPESEPKPEPMNWGRKNRDKVVQPPKPPQDNPKQ